MNTATKVDSVPLAYFIHHSKINFTLAFNTLRENLGVQGFGGLGYPSVFDSQNALNSVFSSSRLLLCLFHLAQVFGKWQWALNNGISKVLF